MAMAERTQWERGMTHAFRETFEAMVHIPSLFLC